MDWILASASPRRKQLFKEVVDAFEIIVANGEERVLETSPKALVQLLAKQKAEEVASCERAQGKCVLGADTVVAYEGEILGKPKDEADAKRMLKMLSGKTHEVYTGVCIVYPDGKEGRKELLRADCTRVQFNELSDAFIDAYVQGGSPMDKAGAYGIQDGGLVARIEGSFTNVVGLPVELCQEMVQSIKALKKG